MYSQRLDSRACKHARIKVLIAGVFTVMVLMVGCGQAVPATHPASFSGAHGGSGQFAP